jgi:uncharacterized protein (DUF1800 family)
MQKLLPLTKKVMAYAGISALVFNTTMPPTALAQESAADDQKILHVLNRLTFGPRPGDADDVKAMGVDKFIEQQLHPQTIPMPQSLAEFLSSDDAINTAPLEMFKQYGPPAIKAAADAQMTGNTEEDRKLKQQVQRQNYQKLYQGAAEARLRRAVESPRQLEEVMTDFWFNHFNVSADKGLCHLWIGDYEQEAIRPNCMGKFRDLVEATSHHPAMLFYLDNWQNTKPVPQDAQANGKGAGRFKGLNENFARELMELHTLGVDGGYTQQDVIQLAKILTGLGLPPQRPGALRPGASQGHLEKFGAYFDPNRHDFGDKVLLGHEIKGTGEDEIEQAIDLLCRAPATAHHISYQLAQYFVADEPPKTLVDKLTKKYEATDGDIHAMLEELFHSPEFWDKKYDAAKFKSPYRYVVSSLRAANVALGNYKPAFNFCALLGMPVYRCLTPDGYKNTQVAWLSGDTLLQRIQFATGLGSGKLPNNELDPLNYEDVKKACDGIFTQQTLDVVAQAPPPLKSSLLLGSPEFMNY